MLIENEKDKKIAELEKKLAIMAICSAVEKTVMAMPDIKVEKVEHKSGGVIGNRFRSFQSSEINDILKEGGEAVINKEVKKDGFTPFVNFRNELDSIKQRLDKLENK